MQGVKGQGLGPEAEANGMSLKTTSFFFFFNSDFLSSTDTVFRTEPRDLEKGSPCRAALSLDPALRSTSCLQPGLRPCPLQGTESSTKSELRGTA